MYPNQMDAHVFVFAEKYSSSNPTTPTSVDTGTHELASRMVLSHKQFNITMRIRGEEKHVNLARHSKQKKGGKTWPGRHQIMGPQGHNSYPPAQPKDLIYLVNGMYLPQVRRTKRTLVCRIFCAPTFFKVVQTETGRAGTSP